jgi:hypothetical protein
MVQMTASGFRSRTCRARSGSGLGRNAEKIPNRALGGIFSCGRESKMEIPAETAKTFSLIALPGYTASFPDQLLYGGFDHYFLSSSA